MNEEKKEIVNIRLDEIIPNRFQPRLTFNEQELNELAESIKMHGIIQPLVLRKINDKYEIIAGERRYKAAQIAGLDTVPALIVEMDDKKSAEVALVENLQRKDLSAIEEAQSYKKILDMGYITQEELALRMGVSQPTIANKLRLLNLSIPVKDALLNNKISERHARSLLAINDTNMQISMLNRIINERLTVRQTDDEIRKLLGVDDDSTSNANLSLFENRNSNIGSIVSNSEEIIAKPKFNDINELLKPESKIASNASFEKENSTLSNDTLAINPFHEIEPEIMNFEFEKPNDWQMGDLTTNSLINEYRQEQNNAETNTSGFVKSENSLAEEKNVSTADESRNISKVINFARQQINSIEDMGFEVDTEEYDFNDMYQIIIKIKKD